MTREQCVQALDTLYDAVNFCDNCPIGKSEYGPGYCRSHEFKDMKVEDLVLYAEVVGFNYDGSDPEPRPDYWAEVCKIQARQTEKGLAKYGQRLEDNEDLGVIERLEYLEEELIDGLMYIEHIKALFRKDDVLVRMDTLKKARDFLDKLISSPDIEEVKV